MIVNKTVDLTKKILHIRIRIMPHLLMFVLFSMTIVPSDISAQLFSENLCQNGKVSIHRNSFSSMSGYVSDQNIDARYYGLNLQVFTNPNLLRGSVTITSSVLVSGIQSFYYDFSNVMIVDSVTGSNIPVSYLHAQEKVTFQTLLQLSKGDLITVTIHYHGVPEVTGFGSFLFDEINGRPSIWTLSEPYGASDWFPCKNTPSDKVDSSDMHIRCAGNLTAVSNGLLKSTINNGDGTVTYHWKNSYPIAQYLISLAISDYVKFFFNYYYNASEFLPVENYIYPETFSGLDSLLLKTNDMMTIFRNLYGEYPFIREKYGHAEFGRQGGMEHQTISSMGVFNEYIMAHELAHQWFGDKITCRDWENIWLNEGFATYSEALYAENAYGKQAYSDFMRLRMSNAKLAQGSVYVQDVNSISEIFSGNRSYAKGSVILHMLRGITGDSLFFRIMKNYSLDTSIAYKTAVTADFQATAEEVTGTDLDYFFNQWIYGEGYPKYDVSWNVTDQGENSYVAKVLILQQTGSNPAFFRMPIDIQITTVSGDTTFRVFNGSSAAEYAFTLDSRPVTFKVDPFDLVLKEVRGEGIIPVSFQLSQNFPNPFNPQTTILFELGKPADVVIEIFDVLGRSVGSIEEKNLREGIHTVEYNATGLASGVYFYRLSAYSYGKEEMLFNETKRMVLVR